MSWIISAKLLENYHCSLVQEAEFWEVNCSAGKQFARLKSTDIVNQYCADDKMKDISRYSQSGMISKRLMGNLGQDLLTWFQVVFLAKTSQQQEKGRVCKVISQAFGLKCLESYARYDHDTHLLKTPQCSFIEGWKQSCLTLTKSGTMRNGVLSELQILAPRIIENDYGYWPTPTSRDWKDSVRQGKRKSPNLGTLAHISQTPASSKIMYQYMIQTKTHSKLQHKKSLGGKLSPNWIEWLMGWPIGWTGLQRLETARFRWWQRSHGTH